MSCLNSLPLKIMKFKLLTSLCGFFLLSGFFSRSAPPKDESVVCIHGFLESSWNMHFMAKNLKRSGWKVFNWNYESRNKKIEEHSQDLVRELQKIASKHPNKPIHFVAHSMGCLIVRSALNHAECPEEAKTGKAILLAPPNQGSSWGRILAKFPFAKKMAKNFSGKQLMEEESFQNLGEFPPSKKILIMAGNLGFNPFITGENDGVVAVHETFLNTPHQHVVIKREHATIVFSKKALTIADQFLSNKNQVLQK